MRLGVYIYMEVRLRIVEVKNTGSNLMINELNCHADIFKGTIKTPKARRIGIHRRKAKGKTYENPVVQLPSNFSELIGAEYWIYKGTAELTHEFTTHAGTQHTGEVVILFIPRKSEAIIK